MQVTAITKFKHGDIYHLLKKLDWSQSELARRTKMEPSRIGDIINLKRRPSVEQAEAIQLAFGLAGEYIDVLGAWPETFEGFKKTMLVEQTKDVEPEMLSLDFAYNVITLPEEIEGISDGLSAALSVLSKREQMVLEELYKDGVDPEICDHLKFAQIGKKFKITREAVRQIHAKALRKLRHPSIKKIILGMEQTDALG